MLHIYKSSRGFNAHVIIIDEAAFISYELLMDTIIPVMGQTETALLAISTALDEGNHYSKLVKLEDKETGEPLFNLIRVGQVCEACKKTTTPWLCNHMAYDTPPWKSVKKQKRMSYIYEGQQYRNLRENFGQIAGSGRQAFKDTLLEKLKTFPPVRITKKPTVVFIGADPGGGGPSDLAMTAMVQKDGMWVIVGLFAHTVRGGAVEEKTMVKGVINSILKHPDYNNAIVVFIPENAPAIAASNLQSYVLGNQRVCTMCEAAGNRPGVPKTNNTTRDMQYIMEMTLSMGNLRFARNIVTYKSTSDEMKKRLMTQLTNFCWDEIPSSNEYADKKYKLHGKIAGENDDLAVSCMMIPYWASVWYRSEYIDYQPFKYYAEHGYFKEFAPQRYTSAQQRYVTPAESY